MRFADDDLAAIRDRVNVHDLLEAGGVQLRRSGAAGSYKALCPFHTENTPSFTVSEQRGTYHCFGCGEHGDVFTWVMRHDGLDFPEAVRHLGAQAGVDLPEPGADDDDPNRQRRDRARAALTVAADFYATQLHASPEADAARHELSKRGFTPEHAHLGGCGYAPRDSAALVRVLREHDISTEAAVDAGLLSPTRRGLTAAFRGRLTFTIRDRRGQPIGFGARRLSDDDPVPGKYKNTAATDLYRKSEVLYGWDRARAAAQKTGRIFVMEGYTDVLAAWASGVDEAVAACGTAFGAGQLDVLTRGLPAGTRLVFCFDGDSAGLKATRSVWDVTIAVAARVEAVLGQGGQDPCSVWEHDGAAGLNALLDTARPLTGTVLDQIMGEAVRSGQPEHISAAARECAHLLARLPDRVLAHQYETRLADRLGAPLPAAPSTPATRSSSMAGPAAPEQHDGTPDASAPPGWGTSEARLLHRLATDPHARTVAAQAAFPHQLLSPLAHTVWQLVVAVPADEGSAATLGRIRDHLDQDHPGAYDALMAATPLPGDAQTVIPELGRELLVRDLDAQIRQATKDAAAGVEGAYDTWVELTAVRDSLRPGVTPTDG